MSAWGFGIAKAVMRCEVRCRVQQRVSAGPSGPKRRANPKIRSAPPTPLFRPPSFCPPAGFFLAFTDVYPSAIAKLEDLHIGISSLINTSQEIHTAALPFVLNRTRFSRTLCADDEELFTFLRLPCTHSCRIPTNQPQVLAHR